MNIKHTVSGNNFHGNYSVTFVGNSHGFTLSPSQEAKWARTLCRVSGCKCGGGYGEGLDPGSARIELADDCSAYYLIPAEQAQ